MEAIAGALAGCLVPETQKAAELQVRQMATTPGFGAYVGQILLADGQVAPGVRQLAGIVIKRFVADHWEQVSPEERLTIKQSLPHALNDPSAKIRSCAASAVASIAEKDLPAEWPELIPWLVGSLKDSANKPNLVHGSARCLAMLASQLDDSLIPHIVPVLFPELLSLVQQQVAIRVKAQALTGNDLCHCISPPALLI
jgi:hypothetical protein